ncbi:MAG: signal peptidase II [Deferribacteraceae bacterium]|jgi:signal peptidase II|nr:signal peptidase II [Deferribacteraceae bacterium]
MNRKIILPAMFCVVVTLDQITKFAVKTNMRLYDSVEIIPGLFNIMYVLNPGAAFGMFGGHSEMFRTIFFIGMTALACIMILALIIREYRFKVRTFAYTAVISGAIGNMLDRLHTGKVVDFLDFYFKNWHWYTFNIADSFITVGIAVLLLDFFVFNKGETKNG